MAELPNKNRTQSGPRGLRGRGRTRPADNGENPSTAPNGNAAAPNQRRSPEGNRNNAQSNKQRRPVRSGRPSNNLDSESDFRALRQSGNQHRTSGSSDDFLHGNSANPGNRARPNARRNDNAAGNGNRRQAKPTRNGHDWSPSDAHSYTGLHQLKGSDWYREDQARYAAKQIAIENSEAGGGNANRGNNTNARGPAGNDTKRGNGQQRNRNRGNTRNRANPNQRNNANPGSTTNKANPNRRPAAANGPADATPAEPTTAAVNNIVVDNSPPKPATSPANGPAKRPARRRTPAKQTDKAPGDANTGQTAAATGNGNDAPTAKKPARRTTAATAPKDQQTDSGTDTASETGKARRAPWRTQKNSAGTTGDSSS